MRIHHHNPITCSYSEAMDGSTFYNGRKQAQQSSDFLPAIAQPLGEVFAGPVALPQALVELHVGHLGEAAPDRLCRVPHIAQNRHRHKVVCLLHSLPSGWVCEVPLVYMVDVPQARPHLSNAPYVLRNSRNQIDKRVSLIMASIVKIL